MACLVASAATRPATRPSLPEAPDRRAGAQGSATERDRELALLGISSMQPGVTAYDIGKPGNANFDETKANPYPSLPSLLTLNDGTRVATAAEWQKRRAELKQLFAVNVYGLYPRSIPSLRWKVDGIETMSVRGIPAIVKHITGHVDNSAYPAIEVELHADVVTPASSRGEKVPVIVGGGSLRPPPLFVPPAPVPGQVHTIWPRRTTHRIQHNYCFRMAGGFVARNSTEVQADNGAGLTQGIIGLVNKGRPRSLTDWGVLRAWAWGDSRILDYLQTDPDVDAHHVGVMGHSRGGKAALIAMVDDPRFAIAYISSSGAGGANLFRRNYGEAVANLAGPSEFHWFAGNFMRYAATGHSADEMPVDSHEWLALVAPRPIFIGAGALLLEPEYAPGDGWQDAQGMFKAAVAASPAWRLSGATGLQASTFPSVGTLLDCGDIAFRQHAYGHTPAPNWPYFIGIRGAGI